MDIPWKQLKATDQNEFDKCEEYEHLNQIVAGTSLIRLVLGDIPCQKLLAINTYASRFEKLLSAISQ